MANVPVFDPETISDAEVKSILSELGYENIHPDHLRQFISDLKRMIRRDQVAATHSNDAPVSLTSQSAIESRKQIGTAMKSSSNPSLSSSSPVSPKDSVFSLDENRQKVRTKRVNVNIRDNELSIEESLSIVKSSSHASSNSERPRTARSTSGESLRSGAMEAVSSGREAPTVLTEVKCKPSQSRHQDPRLLNDPVRLYHWYNTHWKRRPPPSNAKQAATFQPPQFH